MRQSVFKTTLFFLTLIFAYLQYVLWFEEDGILSVVHLKKKLAFESQMNERLKQKNNELYQQIDRMKHDPAVTEGRARGELGMIRKGEKFYQIIK